MAVRIRADGRILCAAATEAMPGDTYLDDVVVERLGSCLPNSLHILVPVGATEDGVDIWEFLIDPLYPQRWTY